MHRIIFWLPWKHLVPSKRCRNCADPVETSPTLRNFPIMLLMLTISCGRRKRPFTECFYLGRAACVCRRRCIVSDLLVLLAIRKPTSILILIVYQQLSTPLCIFVCCIANANHTANWIHYSSCLVYPHLAIYFGSPFGRYPTFHTLTSVGRKKAFQYV